MKKWCTLLILLIYAPSISKSQELILHCGTFIDTEAGILVMETLPSVTLTNARLLNMENVSG